MRTRGRKKYEMTFNQPWNVLIWNMDLYQPGFKFKTVCPSMKSVNTNLSVVERGDVILTFFFSGLCRNFRCDCGNRKFTELQCKLYSVSSIMWSAVLVTCKELGQSSGRMLHRCGAFLSSVHETIPRAPPITWLLKCFEASFSPGPELESNKVQILCYCT